MKPSDDLFQLIQSLTKGEKRHFRLTASLQKGKKQYLRLFDAIEQMEQYDEPALKQQFGNERFVRQFNVAKGYLYNLILKSLRGCYADYNANAQAKDMLKSIAILFEKGLTPQAAKLVQKLLALASEHGLQLALIEALYWQGKVDDRLLRTEEGVTQNFTELYAAVEQYRTALVAEESLFRIRLALPDDAPRTAGQLAEASGWMEQIVAIGKAAPNSLNVQFWGLLGRFLFSIGEQDLVAAHNAIARLVLMFEQHPAWCRERAGSYMMALHNLAASQRMLYDEEGLEMTIAKMRHSTELICAETRPVGLHLRTYLFLTTCLHRLRLLNRMGEFHQATLLAPQINQGIEEYGNHLPDELTHAYHLALAESYFGAGQYRQALEYNNRVLASPPPELRRLAWENARLFNLMIHYELGNIELIEHLIRSAYRYFSQQPNQTQFHRIVLSCFRRLLRMRTPQELQAIFDRTQQELALLRLDPYESSMQEVHRFGLWLAAKTTGENLGELSRKEYDVAKHYYQQLLRQQQEGDQNMGGQPAEFQTAAMEYPSVA
ncbi:MAG: hypothetical protein IT211_09070 [Armatimonadetes bacterium]|nr:hypothetical protein [Armatimonadota bacterium]